jgi:hypothetical protein
MSFQGTEICKVFTPSQPGKEQKILKRQNKAWSIFDILIQGKGGIS